MTATQPIPLSAGDRRVMVNGRPLPVAFRIVSEELWAELKAKLVTKDALIRRAHDAMSRRDPDGVSEADWDQLVSEMAKEVGQ
jgi:hypothetical protein